MTKYFDAIHDDYIALRDHISNYQYAIPTGMFSRYQQALNQLNDLLQEQKDTAIPKKKFAFARKAKKPKQEVKQVEKEESKKEEIDQNVLTGNHLQIKEVKGDMGVVIKASDYEGKENVIIENVQDS